MQDPTTPDTPPPGHDWGNMRFERRDPRPPSYRIGLVAGLVGGLAALVVFALNYRQSGATPEGLGHAGGAAFGVFLFAYLAGWVVFRLRDRRAGGGQLTFVLVALFAFAGQVAQFQREAGSASEQAALLAAMREAAVTAPQAAADEVEDARIPDLVDGQLAAFNRLRTHPDFASTEARSRLEALRGFMQERLTAQLTYALALNRVNQAMARGPAIADDADTLARVVAEMESFDQASARCLAQLRAAPQSLGRHLANAKYREDVRRRIIEGANEGVERTLPTLVELVEANRDFMRVQRAYLEKLGANRRHWQLDAGGGVIVDSESFLAELQALEQPIAQGERRVAKALQAVNALQREILAETAPTR